MTADGSEKNKVGEEIKLADGGAAKDGFVKTFFKFEAIIYGVLALLFIVVTLAGGMKAKTLFLTLLSLFFLGAIILGIVAFVERKEKKSVEKIISIEEAKRLINRALMHPDWADYVRNVVDDFYMNLGSKGKEQKVYVLVFSSDFEGHPIVGWVNMNTGMPSVKRFAAFDAESKIVKKIKERGKLVVSNPEESGDSEEEVVERQDGSRTYRKRSFKKQKQQVRLVEKNMKEIK